MELLRTIETEKTTFISNDNYSIFSEKLKKENAFEYWISVYRYKNSEIVKQGYVTELGLKMLYTNYIHS